MAYKYYQPIEDGIKPAFNLEFTTIEEAINYRNRIVERLELYIKLLRAGKKVGNKTEQDIKKAIDEIKRLELMEIQCKVMRVR